MESSHENVCETGRVIHTHSQEGRELAEEDGRCGEAPGT